MDPEELTPVCTGCAEAICAGNASAAVVPSESEGSNVATPGVAETESNESLRWSDQLQILASMKFANETRSLALLTQHEGDMEAVITDLLS
ncbi:unnamed protein product [Hyaloperonospora brassicae]|uniref:Nascent polypeptide-associated complex subunit alpha-like UBA domain-containing protein n=1 Tax=Hyaloperonospora brassicae TaxID=162125 RepID=A0AAV0SYP4_HYABA|nr:unnamed protein product [Hyaloperonospora brassicae]